MKVGEYIKNHSENIAGIVSLGGSSALLLAGNAQSVVAAGVFTVAELVLARTGHKTAGYSAGAALFAVGDLTLAFSESVEIWPCGCPVCFRQRMRAITSWPPLLVPGELRMCWPAGFRKEFQKFIRGSEPGKKNLLDLIFKCSPGSSI